MIEFMARLTGALFPDTQYPEGGSSGDTNPWDASEHVRALINMIAASPSSAATDALRRLEADPQLASYKLHLLYALDNQQQRRRESEYDRPNWPQTVAALANRAPATVADLHALLMAQLRDLIHRIARANSDIFKQFWNLDRYAKPTCPRHEEACRDDVVTLLKPVLLPLDVTVEPEGHMVGRHARGYLGRDARTQDFLRIETRLSCGGVDGDYRSARSLLRPRSRSRKVLGFTWYSGSERSGEDPFPRRRVMECSRRKLPPRWRPYFNQCCPRICANDWASSL